MSRSEPRRRHVPWRTVVIGVVAGGVLLAVAEVTSLAFTTSSAPLVAVGGGVIDLAPPWLKDLVIELFGTGDKAVLLGVLLTGYLLVTALIGWLGDRRPRAAAAALAGVGIVVAAIVLTRAQNALLDAIPTLLGTVVAVVMLVLLLRAARTPGAAGTEPNSAPMSRRTMFSIVAIGVISAIAVVSARSLNATRDFTSRAAQLMLPRPRRPAVPIPTDAQVDLRGMPEFVTPNDEFYRIDTALVAPRIDPTDWQLRITGLVDREIVLDIDELLAEPMVEAHVTLACVSNLVGGDLVGNATWLGVPTRTLLERAGVQDTADMVLSRSIDGFTASTPLEALTDERDSLVAVGMNGAPLPRNHGFPVRLVVPGLYGYVSATKWLTEMKVTRFADDVAYWSTRGWSERGPIKIASRIDVPRPYSTVTPEADGSVMLGGTAWAQQRGIERVEVRVDNGMWRVADLGAAAGVDTWRQWSLRARSLSSGRHRITVRATSGDGELQTQVRANPAPNGASGWHSIDVTVE